MSDKLCRTNSVGEMVLDKWCCTNDVGQLVLTNNVRDGSVACEIVSIITANITYNLVVNVLSRPGFDSTTVLLFQPTSPI